MSTSTAAAPQIRKVARYGWVPDLPDARDHLFSAPGPTLATLPPAVDLRPGCPPVYDQGQLGSCTANAIGGALEFDLLKQGLADLMPSRLFIYYNERAIEGSTGSDSGAQLRDGIKTVNKQGVCPEDEWPYDLAKFTDAPPASAYADALANRATSYQRVARNLAQFRGCLAAGYPFVFGFTVYDGFESQQVASTGEANLPAAGEKVVGGHAVMAAGYDDSTQRFLVRNSWGDGWGQQGYFTMPYAYLTQRGLSSDFWTIRVVS
ncbi:MAG: C1 family peptidase [Actinomycetota bacterium]|nr:C1 family peptidase [Actinomycetota bacterium]